MLHHYLILLHEDEAIRCENSHHTKRFHYFKKLRNMPFCSMHLLHLSDSTYETYALKLNFLQEAAVLLHQLQVLKYRNKNDRGFNHGSTPNLMISAVCNALHKWTWCIPGSFTPPSPPGTFITSHNQNLRGIQCCLVGRRPTQNIWYHNVWV